MYNMSLSTSLLYENLEPRFDLYLHAHEHYFFLFNKQHLINNKNEMIY